MKIKAISLIQHNKTMYLATMKATDIVKYLKNGQIKVDIWTPDHHEGYQRNHSKTRSRAFAKFIADAKNISPSSILICVRTDGSKQLDYSDGILTIPDGTTLWLTDGQHRVRGLETAFDDFGATMQDFELAVVILPTVDEYVEAKQFVIMNKTQKGVKTDLAERFLQSAVLREGYAQLKLDLAEGKLPRAIFGDIEWRPRSVEIADDLNSNSIVWKGKIQAPNVSQPTKTVSQKSFTDSLKPFLTLADFKGLSKDLQVKILDNYWMSIRDLVPDAFSVPESYIIQKTTGAFALNGILPTVVKYCKDPNTGKYELTRAKFREVLEKIAHTDYMKADSWQASDKANGIIGGKIAQMGTSQKSFTTLRDLIVTELEAALVESREIKGTIIV